MENKSPVDFDNVLEEIAKRSKQSGEQKFQWNSTAFCEADSARSKESGEPAGYEKKASGFR